MTVPSVGLYLGVVQFFFAATWIVYVIYLPQLAAQAGIGKAAVAWILMADQLVFVFADYASGVAADRVARAVGRVGLAVLAATLVSCAAFLALPFVAPGGSPPLFIALTMLWAVTSSALRAPPLALVGKHAAKPAQPILVALSLLGLGIANAFQPYLGLTLRGVDPRLPFALSSVALALVTLGLVAAERGLARTSAARAAAAATPARPAATQVESSIGPAPVLLAAALLSALAFQVHVFIDSAPLYLRQAPATQLPMLSPVFWIGFNLGMLPLSLAARRWPAARVMGAAALVAAAAAGGATVAPGLVPLIVTQLVAGAAWAGVIVAAFAWALARGGAGHAGAFAGAISSVLALATLARMASVAAGWPKAPGLSEALAWWPVVGWLAASAVVVALLLRRPAAARAAAR
ncbi:MAG: MFS transporter [Caldimonas sp.]